MRIFFGIAIGAVIGFGIGYFGKCVSGTCPLTGNPVVSAVLGALVGGMIALTR